MKDIFIKNKNQKGYAILFTVVIVSAISVITAGLTNVAYKQLILSSLAKDSQLAFYQADTAADCALYADRVVSTILPENQNVVIIGGSWSCGDFAGENNLKIEVIPDGYDILPPTVSDEESLSPCFRIHVTKEIINDNGIFKKETTIQARGYNICNMTKPRTVEREIKITYSEEV